MAKILGGSAMGEFEKVVVFVTDCWGNTNGGIDVFNYELCSAMGYIVTRKTKVVCLVVGRNPVPDKRKKEANRNNIEVISYIPADVDKIESEYDDIIEKVVHDVERYRDSPEKAEYIWIGHDIFTGEYAVNLSRYHQRKYGGKDKCAVIFHTDYNSVETAKGIEAVLQSGRGGRYEDNRQNKLIRQQNIMEDADYIFFVGPGLTSKVAERFDRVPEVKEKIVSIIPGLSRCPKRKGQGTHILVGGRFSGSIELVKNWEGICFAIAKALKRRSDESQERREGVSCFDPNEYPILIYGLDPNQKKEYLDNLQKELIIRIRQDIGISVNIKLCQYESNRAELLKALSDSRMFIVGSKSETFGLAAWEAISAEVPVVLPNTSGVYWYLDKKFGHLAEGLCIPVNSNDVEEMSKAIYQILSKYSRFNQSTSLLLDLLKNCTWNQTAIDVAKRLEIECGPSSIFDVEDDRYEAVYKSREHVFDTITHLVEHRDIEKRIIFFGGISTRLLSKEFTNNLLRLLCSEGKEGVDIYYCYEADKAIQQREMMQEIEGINENTSEEEKERLKKQHEDKQRRKAKKASTIKESYCELFDKFDLLKESQINRKIKIESVLERLHIIPLQKSPAFYINIVDDDLYFGLKFQVRSSTTTAIKIKNGEDGEEEKDRMLDHMRFILEDSGATEDRKRLLEVIDRLDSRKRR